MEVVVRMDVYEARRHRHSRDVDIFFCGRPREIIHRLNTIARNPDICPERLAARAVVDGAAAEDEVEMLM